VSYVVSRGTNEIGIRMALWAARSRVRWMVVREITASSLPASFSAPSSPSPP
jgi:hypothetical protein